MARSTYFFTKKKLNEILKLYGGGYRWTLHEELSEKRQISYMDKKGCMLTINEAYEGKNGQFTYVEVRISDASGKIIRKDRFDFTHTNTDDIEFVYSEENGHFYSDFRKVGMTMARATKESKIKELEERVKSLQESLEILSKRNNEMALRAEDSFLNSPTYCQMMEKISFIESLNKLNESHIKHLEKQKEKVSEAVQQVFADNKAMMEHYREGDEENPYFIGITENWHDAKEYMKLKSDVSEFKGKVSALEILLKDREDEITRLQGVVGELKHKTTTTAPSEHIEELKSQIEKLQDDVRKAEGQCKVYQANVFKITESRDLVQKKLGEAKQKISELETQIESIFYRNSDPDLITMYHALEERTERSLDNLKKARKEAKEWKDKYQELKTEQTTTPPPVETESKEPQSVGRPKTDDAKIQKVLKMREDGKPMRTIATELGISLGTVSNIVKKHSK